MPRSRRMSTVQLLYHARIIVVVNLFRISPYSVSVRRCWPTRVAPMLPIAKPCPVSVSPPEGTANNVVHERRSPVGNKAENRQRAETGVGSFRAIGRSNQITVGQSMLDVNDNQTNKKTERPSQGVPSLWLWQKQNLPPLFINLKGRALAPLYSPCLRCSCCSPILSTLPTCNTLRLSHTSPSPLSTSSNYSGTVLSVTLLEHRPLFPILPSAISSLTLTHTSDVEDLTLPTGDGRPRLCASRPITHPIAASEPAPASLPHPRHFALRKAILSLSLGIGHGLEDPDGGRLRPKPAPTPPPARRSRQGSPTFCRRPALRDCQLF